MPGPTRGADPVGNADLDALEAAFRRIAHVVKRGFREFATAMHPDLRQAGWAILTTVLRADNEDRRATVGEIIAETGIDKSVVSRQLRALSDWGLVVLSRSEADARVVVVAGTPLAHERLRAVRAQQRERYAEILGSWSAADRRRLEELLNRVADGFVE
ncbi:MAG: hypothetical protein BGO95_06630 [Micrococcales bacterium 73-13]|nr:MAG: hypothetical protein BGO95_06630 [Micrococcales bacterium 73-13]